MLALAAAAHVPAAAQALEGRVVDTETLQPVAAAQVHLLDAAGEPVAAAVTDESGAFQLRADSAGEFRVWAGRMGLRTTLTRAVPLAAGETVVVEVRMAPEALAAAPELSGVPRRGGISGRVVDDQTGRPVGGATVVMVNARELRAGRAVTDSAGVFHLRVSQGSAYQLRAERMGYRRSTSSPITVMPGDTVQVELRLSTQSVLLAPLTVVAAGSHVMRGHHLAGFEWRRTRQPFGRYMGPDEIERIKPFYASDVLQHVPMVRVEGVVDRQVTLPARGLVMGANARCVPNLYVDGNPMRLTAGLTLDQVVVGRNVAAVEVYNSPSSAPGEFPARDDPFCGVVVIWTRRVT